MEQASEVSLLSDYKNNSGTHSRQLLTVGNCTLNKLESLNDDIDGGEHILSEIESFIGIKFKRSLPGFY